MERRGGKTTHKFVKRPRQSHETSPNAPISHCRVLLGGAAAATAALWAAARRRCAVEPLDALQFQAGRFCAHWRRRHTAHRGERVPWLVLLHRLPGIWRHRPLDGRRVPGRRRQPRQLVVSMGHKHDAGDSRGERWPAGQQPPNHARRRGCLNAVSGVLHERHISLLARIQHSHAAEQLPLDHCVYHVGLFAARHACSEHQHRRRPYPGLALASVGDCRADDSVLVPVAGADRARAHCRRPAESEGRLPKCTRDREGALRC